MIYILIFSISFRIDKYVEDHPVWKENKKGFANLHDMTMMAMYSANSWDDVSTATVKDFHNCPGSFFINWKTNGYKTLLDILMVCFMTTSIDL